MPQPFSLPPEPGFFIELQSVDSTNNYARELLRQARLTERQGADTHLLAVYAREQRAGRGQRGRTWISEKDNNIALSLILHRPPLPLSAQFRLSVWVAVVLRDFLAGYAREEDCRIKWPNDLYWQDRKAGGVLIESGVGSKESGGDYPIADCRKTGDDSQESGVNSRELGDDIIVVDSRKPGGNSGEPKAGSREAVWDWAIVGMGININQVVFPGELPNPVSLRQITEKEWNPGMLARELHASFLARYGELTRPDFSLLLSRYNQCLYRLHQPVRFRQSGRLFTAQVLGVTETGRLRLAGAEKEDYGWGELEWVAESLG